MGSSCKRVTSVGMSGRTDIRTVCTNVSGRDKRVDAGAVSCRLPTKLCQPKARPKASYPRGSRDLEDVGDLGQFRRGIFAC
jgi:hypothetical protein